LDHRHERQVRFDFADEFEAFFFVRWSGGAWRAVVPPPVGGALEAERSRTGRGHLLGATG
jgi:hypothetical protein